MRTLTCLLLLTVTTALAQDGLVEIKIDKDLALIDFLDQIGKATGKALVYDPNGQRIRGQKFGASFQLRVPKSRAFDTFRAILSEPCP